MGVKLPAGLVAVVKQDCPTCQLVVPALQQLARDGPPLVVFSQDDPAFPPGVPVHDDTSLDTSLALDIEIVPTLLKVDERGQETARTLGWNRAEWEALSGVSELAPTLPAFRPGCGSRTLELHPGDE